MTKKPQGFYTTKMQNPVIWQNRITGHGEESPDQLLANPKNHRIHPTAQQEALRGVLQEIGWVQDVVVNRQTGFIVDGHLRVMLALRENQPKIPVKYVDITEAEENLVLLTLDAIAAMAGLDKQQVEHLLENVTTSEPAVMDLLDKIAQIAKIVPVDPDAEQALFGPKQVTCPHCGKSFTPGK